MARKPEPMTFSGALEVQAQKPLDGRRKTIMLADLTDAASFPYIFRGLDVFCDENGKWYTFMGGDQTDINNWREEGTGGGGSTEWSDITNKPTDLVQDAAYVHTDNNYTTSDKDKLASLENYDDTALAARVSANETAIADRYTKAEADALLADKADKATTYTKAETDASLADKQDTLESGVSIKTVNGNSLLGSGNLEIGGGSGTVDTAMSDTSENAVQNKVIKAYVDNVQGLPSGGTNGQILAKNTMSPDNSEWIDNPVGDLEALTTTDKTDAVSAINELNSGKANFDIGTVPLGGAGVYEVNAILNNNDSERVRATYSRGVNGELPDWFSMSVTSGLGTDDFHVATKEYADKEVAKKGNAKITFDNEYQYLQIRDDNGTDIGFSQETAGTVRVQEYAKDSRGQVQPIFDETLASKTYVDGALANKQNTLVSGQNIKSVNGSSLLGNGDLLIREGVVVIDVTSPPTMTEIEGYIKNTGAIVKNGAEYYTAYTYSRDDEAETFIIVCLGAVDGMLGSKFFWFNQIGNDSIVFDRVTDAPSTRFSTAWRNDTLYYASVRRTANDQMLFAVYNSTPDLVDVNFYCEDPRGGTGNIQLPTKGYVDGKLGTHIAVNEEKWVGTYKGDDGVTYQVYSKMIFIPALPATAGVEGYPHGITGIKQILQVYGFTTDGFVLNAPRQNIQDNIGIYQVQKAGNIQIEVGKDRSSKAAYVCLVYAKNN